MFAIRGLTGPAAMLPQSLATVFFRLKTTTNGSPIARPTNTQRAAGRVVHILNSSVIDVEFDTVDDVPKIQSALRMTVKREKFDANGAAVRTLSLLPRQIRAAKARRESLVETEKIFISTGAATAVARETIDSLRSQRAMSEEMLALLEANLLNRQPGL